MAITDRKRWWVPLVIILLASLLMGAADHKIVLTGQAVYNKGAPATFYIRALNSAGELKASGTGFCVTPDGMMLTAAHVVEEADEVHVVLSESKEVTAAVISRDDKNDVAVLRLPKGTYPYLELESKIPVGGEPVYAIGYPMKTTKIVSDGVVSAPVAKINGIDRLLISAQLASGMSGGPVMCEHGKVIGVNAATLRTMNGISTSPTTRQILDAVAAAQRAEITVK